MTTLLEALLDPKEQTKARKIASDMDFTEAQQQKVSDYLDVASSLEYRVNLETQPPPVRVATQEKLPVEPRPINKQESKQTNKRRSR